MEIAFFWFAFAIVVGVAASSRGRNGFGWFILAVLISPLIGLLLVLVMPNRRLELLSDGKPPQPFEPDGIHAGIPYRVMRDGSINAVMQGATVRFADHDKFAAATGSPLQRRAMPPVPEDRSQRLSTLANIPPKNLRK
jgi:hypothetical protein